MNQAGFTSFISKEAYSISEDILIYFNTTPWLSVQKMAELDMKWTYWVRETLERAKFASVPFNTTDTKFHNYEDGVQVEVPWIWWSLLDINSRNIGVYWYRNTESCSWEKPLLVSKKEVFFLWGHPEVDTATDQSFMRANAPTKVKPSTRCFEVNHDALQTISVLERCSEGSGLKKALFSIETCS